MAFGGMPPVGYAPRGSLVWSSQYSGISPYMPTLRSPIRRPALPGLTPGTPLEGTVHPVEGGFGDLGVLVYLEAASSPGSLPDLGLLSGDGLLLCVFVRQGSLVPFPDGVDNYRGAPPLDSRPRVGARGRLRIGVRDRLCAGMTDWCWRRSAVACIQRSAYQLRYRNRNAGDRHDNTRQLD